MLYNDWNGLVLNWLNLFITVLEDLHVTHAPVAEEHHIDWSSLHNAQGSLVKLVIVHWWALIVVSNKELLANVVEEVAKCSNQEEFWKADTVHESDADCGHECRVLS